MDMESQALENGDTPNPNSRKRPAAEMDEENEDLVDQLLPAAAAMKRRRIEEEEEAARTGKSTQQLFGPVKEEARAAKLKKPKKEVNIKEVVRERREAEEDAVRREEEELKDTMDGVNVEGMRNLAVVEEMELPDRAERPQRKRIDGTGSRWDERWNGRKNFKKFRRQGEGTQARRGQSVMVPLEEVKKKGFGIGEDYWLESNKSKKRKARERTSQSQSQPYTTARSLLDEEVADLEGEGSLGTDDAEAPNRSTNHSQLVSEKRAAPDRGTGPAAKKQKTFGIVEKESDSESEDELKFRFKKRR